VKLSNDLAPEPDPARQEDGDFNSGAPNMLQEHVVKGRSALCGPFLFLSDDRWARAHYPLVKAPGLVRLAPCGGSKLLLDDILTLKVRLEMPLSSSREQTSNELEIPQNV
jgi:hypothetical protein